MVQAAPHHSPPSSEPTLDVAWRAAANRLPIRGIVACIIFGLAGAITLAGANRVRPVATACVVLAAFGAYAAVVQPSLGGDRLHPTTQRLVAATIGIIAVLAGLATGLLVLATIFGGSIEVMRR
jgi:hypothetical protein